MPRPLPRGGLIVADHAVGGLAGQQLARRIGKRIQPHLVDELGALVARLHFLWRELGTRGNVADARFEWCFGPRISPDLDRKSVV